MNDASAGQSGPDPATEREQGKPTPRALQDWTAELIAELELDPDDAATKQVLDLARDIAHQVARPAAPLSAFLVGLAAGKQGGTREQVNSMFSRTQALIARFTAARSGADESK